MCPKPGFAHLNFSDIPKKSGDKLPHFGEDTRGREVRKIAAAFIFCQ
jgi:hypothetical protein